MDIAIHTPHLKAEDDAIREAVLGSLQRFGDRLTRVEVFVKDVNANKGGIDKHCVVEARPRGLDPVVAEDDAGSLLQAVNGAAGKLQRLLEHKFGKLNNHRPHQKTEGRPAEGDEAEDGEEI